MYDLNNSLIMLAWKCTNTSQPYFIKENIENIHLINGTYRQNRFKSYFSKKSCIKQLKKKQWNEKNSKFYFYINKDVLKALTQFRAKT